MEQINEYTFIRKALKSYDNPSCVSLEEFENDLFKFSFIKKLLTLYQQSGELNERLVLNYIIICFNLFNHEALLFLLYKVDRECWPSLFPFLIYIDRLPEFIPEFHLNTSDIILDTKIIDRLRQL